MFRLKSKRILPGMFVLLCVLLFMPLSSHAEKKDVRILGLWDLTGPYAAGHQLALQGAKDYFKWANENNYIPGVNLQYEIYDHGADVSKCVAAYQIAVNKKPKPVLSCGGFTSPTVLAIKPLAKRYRIPAIEGSTARNTILPPGWYFGIMGSYEGMVGACGDWVVANWKPDSDSEWIRKHYEKRRPRMGIIGWDNAMGRAFDQKETRDYLKKIGVDFVGSEYIPVSPGDCSAQILRLIKQQKADFVYFGMYPGSHALILKDAERLGLRDDFQDFLFWYGNIMQVQKHAGELAEGTMHLTAFKVNTSEWESQDFVEIFKKSKLPELYAFGYSCVVSWFDVYLESIRRAIKKVGIENLDGSACYDALITMKDFRPMLSYNKVTFSETSRCGGHAAAMYQMQNGKVVKVAEDLYVPELFPGGKDVVK